MSDAPYEAWNGSFTAAGVREWRSALQAHLSQEWDQLDALLRGVQSACAPEAPAQGEPAAATNESLRSASVDSAASRPAAAMESDPQEASHPSRLSCLAHRIEARLHSVLPVALRRQAE